MSLVFLLAALLCVTSVAESDKVCHKIVTSNVGFTKLIKGLHKRIKVVETQYAKSDADVICGEEFWHEDHMKPAVKSGNFPHHFSKIHHAIDQLEKPAYQSPWSPTWSKDQGVCKGTETFGILFKAIPCVLTSGCYSPGMDIRVWAGCLVKKCGQILDDSRASSDCIGCVFMYLVGGSLVDSFYFCQSAILGRMYNSPGLMLLSKLPILSARYVSYFPDSKMMFQRGYIEAEIQDVGKVVCTHLSSKVGAYFEYDLPFSNYEEQQRSEIQHLLSTFQDTEHILLGDMNTGPEVRNNVDLERNLTEEFQDNYALFIQAGYESPYMAQDGRCTFCEGNPLTYDNPNVAIDHVMLMGDNYEARGVQRIWDNTLPELMSDHYAVEVTVCQ